MRPLRNLFQVVPWLALALLPCSAGFVTGCGAQSSDGPSNGGQSGGNTNWLTPCDRDADCDDEDACIAEVCMKPCDGNDVCIELNAGARCEPAAQISIDSDGECVEEGSTPYCTLECEETEDCADFGSAYTCDDGVCAPHCEAAEPTQTTRDSGSEPTDDPSSTGPTNTEPTSTDPITDPDDAECLVVVDTTEACVQPHAVPRSEYESNLCLQRVDERDEPTRTDCPPAAGGGCLPIYEPLFDSLAVPDGMGGCTLEPPCDDGTCNGSPCDPGLGCASDGMVCLADACDGVGACRQPINRDCPDAFDPVCGCDGTTYANACSAMGAPIAHDGECEPVILLPDPPVPNGDECVVALDITLCCPNPRAQTRQDLADNPCLLEWDGTERALIGEAPSECLNDIECVDLPCPPAAGPGLDAVPTPDGAGGCTLEPACTDATCAGSPCTPAVGCAAADGVLICEALSCEATGVCREPAIAPTCTPSDRLICSCEGVTYSCAEDLPIYAHEGPCTESEDPGESQDGGTPPSESDAG